ncbi:hypothetical protein BLEM_2058 [Bifidobacterium lemurum]|uniref:Uncharacterized protein n=1 Tax=Bifidobacterium lemurum TaxID=1603886 RepID=A0A261FLN8_9BIFI|nr:hypothetical protein [Bifidobacterium lemurum]OZG59883.1 hypothetical protein BLEM_2058 [Bifidobacterium lemurum]QOL33913.1 hypothetical protein BL8807_09115 [Bifidobacterium lemurum]
MSALTTGLQLTIHKLAAMSGYSGCARATITARRADGVDGRQVREVTCVTVRDGRATLRFRPLEDGAAGDLDASVADDAGTVVWRSQLRRASYYEQFETIREAYAALRRAAKAMRSESVDIVSRAADPAN